MVRIQMIRPPTIIAVAVNDPMGQDNAIVQVIISRKKLAKSTALHTDAWLQPFLTASW